MRRFASTSMVLVMASIAVSGQGPQETGSGITDVSLAIRAEAQQAFRRGTMCFIWAGTRLVVKDAAGLLTIGPFYTLADRALQFRIWTTVPGSIQIDDRVLSASPVDAGQFEVRLPPKAVTGVGQIAVKLSGHGSPSDVWAGRQISNVIELTVDTEKMEARVVRPHK